MKYHYLKIILDKGREDYKVKWVLSHSIAPYRGSGEWCFSEKLFTFNWQYKLGDSDVSYSIRSFCEEIKNGTEPPQQHLEKAGEYFYDLIIAPYGEAFSTICQCRGEFGLRLLLDIRIPELVSVPWELLWHEEFIARKPGFSIARFNEYVSAVQINLKTPLKVLIVSASPADDPFSEDEYNRHEDRFKFHVIKQATREKLHEELSKKNEYNLFHFIGHGNFDERNGGIYLLKGDRDRDLVSAPDLSSLLKSAGISFVFLCSCNTGETSIKESYRGVAQNLILKGGIPSVIAMPYKFPQGEVAKKISSSFYENLLKDGNTVDEALFQARLAIECERGSWCIPVLYAQYSEWNVAANSSAIETLDGVLQGLEQFKPKDGVVSALSYIITGFLLVGINISCLTSLSSTIPAFIWISIGIWIWTCILILGKRWSQTSALVILVFWLAVWLAIFANGEDLVWALGLTVSICVAIISDKLLSNIMNFQSQKFGSTYRLRDFRKYILLLLLIFLVGVLSCMFSYGDSGFFLVHHGNTVSFLFNLLFKGMLNVIQLPFVIYGMPHAAAVLKKYNSSKYCIRMQILVANLCLLFGVVVGVCSVLLPTFRR
jgi:hypothetical protein